VSTGVPLASGKSEIFEIVLQFMPDWVQIPVLVLVILLVVGSWVFKIKRKIDRRRAARQVQAGPAVQTSAQHGQGRGSDYLGPYAPQQQAEPQPAQPSGADFLGAYAPQQPQGNTPA
jgi:flagellar biosynthesis/type III secretory pathway M-ring protein FliF/YscJ